MKVEKFMKDHIIMVDIAVIVVGLFFLAGGSVLFANTNSGLGIILSNIIGRVVPSILFFCLLRYLHMGFKRTEYRESLKIGFLLGVPMVLCMIIFQIIVSGGKMKFDQSVSLLQIAVVIFKDFCVGVFEEMMLRAVVFQSMILKWKEKKNGVVLAAVVSSVLFGGLHFVNLFTTPQLINTTISQICYAIFAGIFLCGIYYKTKNIWVPIIVHAVVDMTNDLPEILSSWYSANMMQDVSVQVAIAAILLFFPAMIMGLWCIFSAEKKERQLLNCDGGFNKTDRVV